MYVISYFDEEKYFKNVDDCHSPGHWRWAMALSSTNWNQCIRRIETSKNGKNNNEIWLYHAEQQQLKIAKKK